MSIGTEPATGATKKTRILGTVTEAVSGNVITQDIDGDLAIQVNRWTPVEGNEIAVVKGLQRMRLAESVCPSTHQLVPRSIVDALGELVDIVENAADYLVTHEGGGYPAETVALVKSWFAEESK